MSNRTIRINELVQRELSDILRKRHQAESVAVTITEVRVAPDLRDARVFVAVVGGEDTAQEKLRWIRRIGPSLRGELGRRIVLKFIPRLEFTLDSSTPHSLRVLQLIDEIDRSGAAPAPAAGQE